MLYAMDMDMIWIWIWIWICYGYDLDLVIYLQFLECLYCLSCYFVDILEMNLASYFVLI